MSEVPKSIPTETGDSSARLHRNMQTIIAALDGLFIGLLAESADRRITFVNQTFCRLFGIADTPAALLGTNSASGAKSWSALFDDPDAFVARIDELTERTEALRDERLTLKDGRSFSRDFFPFVDDDGSHTLCWVYRDMRDLAHQRLYEKELENLAKFPDENPNPVLRTTPEGVLSYANTPSQFLMDTWKLQVGDAMPDELCKLVSLAFATNSMQHQNVACGARIFSLEIRPVAGAGHCNIYGRDITARQRAEEALQHRLEELDALRRQSVALSDFAGFLHAATDATEVFSIVQQFGPRIFPSCSGTLHFASEGCFEEQCSWGRRISDAVYRADVCWAVRRGSTHMVGPGDTVRCTHLRTDGETAFCVPISVSGQLEGVLTLVEDHSDAQASATPQMASGLAELLQLSLSNLRMREGLRRDSLVDVVTGLHNRRYGEQAGRRLVERARRDGLALAVIMLDIDHFKRINDGYGHAAGDQVLRIVSEVLRNSVRPGDIVCRYGGEEFLLMLLGADQQRALGRAELVRVSIAALEVSHEEHVLRRTTVSQGIAMYPAHADELSTLIERADAALYQAKETGRDRCVVASDSVG